MLKRLLLALALTALLGAGYAVAAGMTVTMTPTGPQPPRATVAWGDTVTFVNADDKAHQILIPRVSLEGPMVPSGGTFEYVFDGRRGNYGYRQAGGGPNRLGTIVVELKGSVTLKPSATIVPWGGTLRLSGVSTFPATPVNVFERVPGSSVGWAQAGTAAAAADGSYTLDLQPQRGAQYRAQVAADQVSSAVVRIYLRPLASVRALAKRAKVGRPVTFAARVTPPHAATMLDLQRLDARHGRWLTDLRKRVTPTGAVTFKWKAVKGATRLRVAVRPLALKAGWVETISRPVTVTGVE